MKQGDNKNELAHHRGAGGKVLTWVGLAFSLAYIGAMTGYAIHQSKPILNLSPDQFGTLLGGVVGPLAFGWLVLGFFQQGEELRHSADALWLQGRELQQSVEQQRQLVSVSKSQLKAEQAARVLAQEESERVARNSLITMQATLLRDFTREFDALMPIRYVVALFAIDRLAFPETNGRPGAPPPPEIWRMMDFFDRVSMYLKRGYLDQQMAFVSFFYWMAPYWQLFSDDVTEMKKQAPLAMWDEIPVQLAALEAVGAELGITVEGIADSKSRQKILEFFEIEAQECKPYEISD